MGSVRINISLPEEIFDELSREIKNRKRSRFITEAIKHTLKEIKEQRLAAEYFINNTHSPIISISPITSNVTRIYSFEVEVPSSIKPSQSRCWLLYHLDFDRNQGCET